MLLVVIGYRRKGGVSKTRVGEILQLDAALYLDDLLSFGLIYCDPSRELNFWRPTPEALLALGLRSFADIPALKELEEWFDTQEEFRAIAKLDSFFEKTSKLASRRFKRELERRGTLGGEPFALEPDPSLKRFPTEESDSDLFRSDGSAAAASSPATPSRRRALCRAARLGLAQQRYVKVPQDSCQLPVRKRFAAIPELPKRDLVWSVSFWGLDPDRILKLVLREIILCQEIQMPPGGRRPMGAPNPANCARLSREGWHVAADFTRTCSAIRCSPT